MVRFTRRETIGVCENEGVPFSYGLGSSCCPFLAGHRSLFLCCETIQIGRCANHGRKLVEKRSDDPEAVSLRITLETTIHRARANQLPPTINRTAWIRFMLSTPVTCD